MESATPLEPEGLRGPFESPDAYLMTRANSQSGRCAPHRGKPSVQAKSLIGKNDIDELMLFRVKTGDVCSPTEHCFMAIRTDAGW
jgi:hypothetical protein